MQMQHESQISRSMERFGKTDENQFCFCFSWSEHCPVFSAQSFPSSPHNPCTSWSFPTPAPDWKVQFSKHEGLQVWASGLLFVVSKTQIQCCCSPSTKATCLWCFSNSATLGPARALSPNSCWGLEASPDSLLDIFSLFNPGADESPVNRTSLFSAFERTLSPLCHHCPFTTHVVSWLPLGTIWRRGVYEVPGSLGQWKPFPPEKALSWRLD